MCAQHVRRFSRRRFLGGLTLAGTAGLLGLHARRVAAEPPPETTKITLVQTPSICLAPQYVAEDFLRAEGFTAPIIMLTARGQEIDKVVGLELGADDYVTKPFSIRELLARVRAILRRTDGTKKRLSRYRFADLELDFETYRAKKAGEPLDLSPREFELLRYLIERKGETVSRDRLLEDVWGYESYPSTRTVDTHIAKLRAKIGDSGSEPRHILTIHGMGYKFVDAT